MMRRPAVAGQFYPADPDLLAATVDGLLDGAISEQAEPADAYVVPHAGYRYSGPTAAYVYSRLRRRSDVDRVVLIGPAHFVGLDGCAVPASAAWLTPLAAVALDVTGARALVAKGLAVMDDEPHSPEHSLEVQVPFLQRALGRFRLLPIAVGVSSVDSVAACLNGALGDGGAAGRTVVICSTDLSHYLDESAANARDEHTVGAICELAPERIAAADACGVFALRGLLDWARSAKLRPRILHRTTSASTGGPRSRVVGYAAIELLTGSSAGD
jgi:AmmeMemoRadiSam system protein B